jgi:ABC-2 type transport system permease protein
MNIYLREMKASIKSLLIWTASISFVIVIWMAEFSAFANDDSLMEMFDTFPEGMMRAFGFEAFNITTLTGFMGLIFTYVMLVLCIHAILKGNSVIAKEERDKTVEFALVLPVKRERIITAKLAAAVTNSILLLAYLYGFVLAISQRYLPEEGFMKFFGLLILGTFILQMVFVSVGVMLGCVLKRYKKSGYIGASLIIGLYILSIMIDFSDKIEFLKYVTPFKYFSPTTIHGRMELDWVYVVISAAVIISSLAAGFLTYRRRDLYI